MAVPVLVTMVPVAVEVLGMLLSADENARQHEIARAEAELSRLRIELEASRIALDRETLEAKCAAYAQLLDALKATFKTKSDMVQAILSLVLAQHAADADATRREQSRLQKMLNTPGLKSARYIQVSSQLAEARMRETQLRNWFKDMMEDLERTILALAPADFSALDRLRGLLA